MCSPPHTPVVLFLLLNSAMILQLWSSFLWTSRHSFLLLGFLKLLFLLHTNSSLVSSTWTYHKKLFIFSTCCFSTLRKSQQLEILKDQMWDRIRCEIGQYRRNEGKQVSHNYSARCFLAISFTRWVVCKSMGPLVECDDFWWLCLSYFVKPTARNSCIFFKFLAYFYFMDTMSHIRLQFPSGKSSGDILNRYMSMYSDVSKIYFLD